MYAVDPLDRTNPLNSVERMILKMLVGAAVTAGCIVAATSAGAEPDLYDADASLFGGLTCSCSQPGRPAGPAASDEINRGLLGSQAVYQQLRTTPLPSVQ